MIVTAYLVALIMGIEVVNVQDGDTLTFKTVEGFEIQGRLIGIDCPEVAHRSKNNRKKSSPGQPMGEEAKSRLTELLKEPFEVKSFGREVFGRTLILLRRGSKPSVNEALVGEGLCEVYRQSRKTKDFDITPLEQAEKKAKQAKAGIWGLGRYETPAQYRKRYRN